MAEGTNALDVQSLEPRLQLSKLRASCDRCREKKLKCSRDHPSCATCLGKKFACVYSVQKQIGGREKRPASNVTQYEVSEGGSMGSGVLDQGHYGAYPPTPLGYGHITNTMHYSQYSQNGSYLPMPPNYGHNPMHCSQFGQNGGYPPMPPNYRHSPMHYSQFGQYGSYSHPPAPPGDGQQYHDTHTTPPTKQHWRELTESWRADVRQIACNILLAAGNGNGISKAELVDAVLRRVEELARIHGTSVATEIEMLTARLVRVLETYSLTFITDDDFYSLTNNLTQVMDSASQMALFSKLSRPYQKQAAYGFTISCVRDSGPSQVKENIDQRRYVVLCL
ncbi:hypothetical protein LTR56_013707 [Elasticomyces elasticus]|nr:hypothetical protein LTR56_013707 [Elasticomyces elasticus]KAK3668471.1 hypothetical protein LTR22_000764 [Elasticomyces elasticus]KAK4930840.1 hypothetical protein LTR49_002605 [Elasticomyces elasticus]KAK5753709.1 hypothetical protein LTS12_016234 [Elasticomyces elasticus]